MVLGDIVCWDGCGAKSESVFVVIMLSSRDLLLERFVLCCGLPHHHSTMIASAITKAACTVRQL